MKTLLAVLSMIPGLTATSPLPPRTVDTSRYYDFEAIILDKFDDDNNQYEPGTCYKVNVKNTGEGYIKDICFVANDKTYSYANKLENSISDCYVVAPNQEATFIVSANYDTDSLDNFEIYVNAYTAFTDELTVTGSKTITTERMGEYYSNKVDMSFGHIGRDRYCYGAIIKAYVEEKETYFILDEWDYFSFATTKEVRGNENNEIEVIKMLKTEYRAYEQELGQIELSRRLNKGCNGSIIFGAPAAASLGLVTTFVVVLRRKTKKNKSK
jgi:hypothetical protein